MSPAVRSRKPPRRSEAVHRQATAAAVRMTLWRGQEPLVLASQSKARQTLLANAGIEFESDPADIDERAIQISSGLSGPGDIASLLAREKARMVSGRGPSRYVAG